MNMTELRERFPEAKHIEITELIQTEEVGKGPWRLYVYDAAGFHRGGVWFRLGKTKYPDEEITFSNARERAANAVAAGREVRICDGMDHLVFRAVDGQITHGSTFWNEANPDPLAVKVAERLKGRK